MTTFLRKFWSGWSQFWSQFWLQFWPEFKKDWWHGPNLITEFRLLATPVAAILYLASPDRFHMVAFWVIVGVALTDKLDGSLARFLKKHKRKGVTVLGTFLDAAVDKVFIVASLVPLCIVNPWIWAPTIIIAVREIYVFVYLRRAKNRGEDVAVVYSGKVKMVAQCVMVAALYTMPFANDFHLLIVVFSVIVAVVLTVLTGYDYYVAFKDAKQGQAQVSQ